jgi:hypothetical protein
MSVCRRPDCDRTAADELGFCADDHASYLRSRDTFADLVTAAQVKHADAFALVPLEHRAVLAEYLVAVASEGVPSVRADIPRSAVLLAAALIAHGRAEHRIRNADVTRITRRRRPGDLSQVRVGERSR